MCGIAGILFFNTDTVQSALLKKMTRSMSHRGPDSEGIFHTNQIGLCHRRLSIIDLSTYANQPFLITVIGIQLFLTGKSIITRR